jgi:hypothetical protein
MQSVQNNYATNFADQQNILSHINSVLSPVLEAGPSQTGFSPSELAALNTQAVNATGANYKNAAVALNSQLAGRGGGSSLPESGVDQQLKEGLASSAAGQLSNQELGITESDYATGRSNFQNAESAELAASGQYNPNATGSLANEVGQNAFQEADTINQESNQATADIAGGITSLASAGLSGGMSLLKPGGGGNNNPSLGNYTNGVLSGSDMMF